MRKITWITTLALAAALGCTKQGTTETSGTASTSAQTDEDRQNQSGTAGTAGMEPGHTPDARQTGTTGTESPTGSTGTTMDTTGGSATGTTDSGSMGTTDSTDFDRQNQAGSMSGAMMYKISRVDASAREVVLVPHAKQQAGTGTSTGTSTDTELQSGAELRLGFDDFQRLVGSDATGGDITSSLREGGMVKIVPVSGTTTPTAASDIQSIKMKDKKHDKHHQKTE